MCGSYAHLLDLSYPSPRLFDEKEVANAPGAETETVDAVLRVAREAEQSQNARRAEGISKPRRQLDWPELLPSDDQIAVLQRHAVGRINLFAVICAFVFAQLRGVGRRHRVQLDGPGRQFRSPSTAKVCPRAKFQKLLRLALRMRGSDWHQSARAGCWLPLLTHTACPHAAK